MLMEGNLTLPWQQPERESRLVFIGRNLDADELRRGFETCAA